MPSVYPFQLKCDDQISQTMPPWLVSAVYKNGLSVHETDRRGLRDVNIRRPEVQSLWTWRCEGSRQAFCLVEAGLVLLVMLLRLVLLLSILLL